jgi:GNAT superfamily N-acetyltransferase
MTLDEMRAAYCRPGADPSVVVLADARPVAVMLGTWFADGRVLLLSYLSVDRSLRGTGVGARLVGEVVPAWCAGRDAAVLAEVDDPRRWPADDDAGDPRARLRFYDRLGARLLPLPYLQPSLRPGSPRVEGMLLLRLDRSATAPRDVLAAFLEEYFTACEGPASLADPPVSGLLERARGLDLERDAWPVSRWPQIPAA